MAASAPAAACPLCGSPSDRVQRRSRRTVTDRPWGRRRVVLVVRVRRFWCLNGACPRWIFAERFPALVAPSAQRTACQQAEGRAVGLALGGRAGARLAGRLGLAVSHDTLLRLAAGAPLPAVEPPRVVGIDDFAFRRGRASGTLAVDLERRRPIAVLPDRSDPAVDERLFEHTIFSAAASRRTGEMARGYDAVPRLGEITAPTLLLVGRDDVVTPPSQAERLRAGSPDAEIVIVERRGHYPFVEEHDAVVAAVRGWLDRKGRQR